MATSDHAAVANPATDVRGQELYQYVSIGGENSGGRVRIYDALHDTWIGGEEFASNGVTGGFNDIHDDTSLTDTDEVYKGTACATDNYIAFVGGEIAGSPSAAVYVLDPSAGTWSELSSTLPTGAADKPMVVEDPTNTDIILVFGGDDGTNHVADATRVDLANDTTTSLTNVPQGGVLACPTGEPVIGNTVYVTGEFANSGDYANQGEAIYAYDVEADSYEQITSFKGKLTYHSFTNRYGIQSGLLTEINGYLFGMSGNQFHTGQDVVYYDPDTDSWVGRKHQIAPPTTNSFDAYDGEKVAAVMPDDTVVLGGTGNDGDATCIIVPELEPEEFTN